MISEFHEISFGIIPKGQHGPGPDPRAVQMRDDFSNGPGRQMRGDFSNRPGHQMKGDFFNRAAEG